MKRIKLADRVLPSYSTGEEIMNMVTHIVGGVLGICALLLCLHKAVREADLTAILCSIVYGVSMTALYAVSSIYHGLRPGTAKKVMQVVDHCTIYFLISGTYTPILMCSFRQVYPDIAWGLLALQWGLAVIAATLTAIDLRRWRVVSMLCYIGMGWSIVFFLRQTYLVLGSAGFWLTLLGGIVYTIGAIAYGLGVRKKWMHSVFHIFVVLGSLLQFLCVYLYVI